MQLLDRANIFKLLFEKKMLFGISNRSKIFQRAIEIKQIYERNKPKKMHQNWPKSYF